MRQSKRATAQPSRKKVARKSAAKKSARPASAGKTRPARKSPAVSKKTPPAIAAAEVQSPASAKFANAEASAPKAVARPTLPSSYGESRLMLLPRDPETLFAAWDLAPAAIEGLKARIGARAFAVSPFTLRLTPSGGVPAVLHVGKKARSRYLKIQGAPSYTAEIGFTTPTGAFELIARSAPCVVPMGPVRAEGAAPPRRTLSYREAKTLIRQGALKTAAGRVRGALAKEASRPSAATAPRTLGGASDLYRR